MARLSCEIIGNQDEILMLQAENMNELVDKIIAYTTASRFEIEHYTQKNKVAYLDSGWFYKKEKQNG
jgi:hypothetical protein